MKANCNFCGWLFCVLVQIHKKMNQIKNRFSGEIIAESEEKSIRQLATEFYKNLSRADLRGADLSGADLRGANLSDAKGLLNAAEFLSQFESDELGIIVYKKIGNTTYCAASHWKIEAGEFLTEVVNPNRQNDCGCGVNFATLEWCEREYKNADLWKCRIRFLDLADVVVPFRSDGKARCARLELLEIVK